MTRKYYQALCRLSRETFKHVLRQNEPGKGIYKQKQTRLCDQVLSQQSQSQKLLESRCQNRNAPTFSPPCEPLTYTNRPRGQGSAATHHPHLTIKNNLVLEQS